SLQALGRALAAAGTLTTQKLITNIEKAGMPPTKDGAPMLASVEAAIRGLIDVLKDAGAKKSLVADAQSLLDLIGRHREVSLPAFESSVRSVASASRGNADRTGATPVDTKELVESYLQRLEAALGNDTLFRSLHRELSADVRINKTEAIEIASRFFEPMPASATRRRAMQKILYRHQKLMDSRPGLETIGAA